MDDGRCDEEARWIFSQEGYSRQSFWGITTQKEELGNTWGPLDEEAR